MRLLRFESGSEHETERLGEKLGSLIPDGAAVLLKGGIGAGKTCFARGLAKGLGIDPSEVSSPTFTLVHEHRGARDLYHMDLYRVSGPAEAEESGLMEYFGRPGVIIVEWPDPIEWQIAEGAAVVTISPGDGEDSRHIAIELPDCMAPGMEGQ